MGVDHSKSLLRVTFHGLFIITRNGLTRWEIGVPNFEDHSFGITRRRITGGDAPQPWLPPYVSAEDRQFFIEPDTNINTDIFDPVEFNRRADVGDINDYRWVIDMEGPEYHDRRLILRPDGVGYKAKIFINGGLYYTDTKTVENYKRVKTSNPDSNIIDQGKIGLIAGVNLPRANIGPRSITFRNDQGVSEVLRQEKGIRYELRFTHTPQDIPGAVGVVHFQHYYNVLKDYDNVTRFDVVERNHSFSPTESRMEHNHGRELASSPQTHGHEHVASPPGGGGGAFGANEPQVCNPIFLGSSVGLPQ